MRSKTFDALLARIRSEYKEMPGLRLTADQSSRLWGLEHDQCEELLSLLAAEGFLVVGDDAKYHRPSDCAPDVRPQMAKATLRDDRKIADRPADRRAGER